MDESDIGNRDPALKSTYKDLVNIRYVFEFNIDYILNAHSFNSIACMHSWSDQVGAGQPEYSAIIRAIPNINKKYLPYTCSHFPLLIRL